MSLDIKLTRVDKAYNPGEKVSGTVVVNIPDKGGFSHKGIKLVVEGAVTLQLSARSIGLFEAFYSSLKPLQLLHYEIEVAPSGGKVPQGITEIPFEFVLQPVKGQQLHDTYHGVYVNVQYTMNVEMNRGSFTKKLTKNKEFIVELASDAEVIKTVKAAKPFKFKISPDSLQNVRDTFKKKIPEFIFEGHLDRTTFSIDDPFSGELTVKKCPVDIKSIELQLVRVESCAYMEGEAREATEIQNIQIVDGNIPRGLAVPIHMVFPRLFTCCTTITKLFKVEFEVNLIILFSDNHMVTENFPIILCR